MTDKIRTVGSGGRVVPCLPGWFGSSTGWGWLPELVDGETYTWVFPDYRGYGERRGVAGEHTLDEIAADVLAVADGLGADRFALLGHSMGGTAAARVLVEAPERVSALVGVSPVPASGVPFDDAPGPAPTSRSGSAATSGWSSFQRGVKHLPIRLP